MAIDAGCAFACADRCWRATASIDGPTVHSKQSSVGDDVRMEQLSAMRGKLFPPAIHEQVDVLLRRERPLTVLDVGCGLSSPLEPLRSRDFRLVGLDVSERVVSAARRAGTFDDYRCGDFRSTDIGTFDAVAMFDFIEHFEKDEAFAVLRRAEEIATKFVIVMTPTGFVPQGPEYGNEFQRHRSGWFAEDFIGRGYTVEGARNVRFLHGYGAERRVDFRGFRYADAALFQLLQARRKPHRAFHMIAVKDLRGVPARYVESTRPG